MATLVDVPANRLFYIEKLFAFVSTDEQGNEGVCGYFDRYSGMMVAMVGADQAKIDQLMPIAKELAGMYAQTHRKVRLVVFETRREVEEIQP